MIHEKYVTVQDFSFDIKQGCERIPAAATVSVAHLQAALVPPGTDQRLMGSRSVSGCVCVCPLSSHEHGIWREERNTSYWMIELTVEISVVSLLSLFKLNN